MHEQLRNARIEGHGERLDRHHALKPSVACMLFMGHVMGPRHGATSWGHVMGPRHGVHHGRAGQPRTLWNSKEALLAIVICKPRATYQPRE